MRNFLVILLLTVVIVVTIDILLWPGFRTHATGMAVRVLYGSFHMLADLLRPLIRIATDILEEFGQAIITFILLVFGVRFLWKKP